MTSHQRFTPTWVGRDGANLSTMVRLTRRAWIAFAACSVLWGIPYFFIKVAVDDLPAVFVAWARIALAAAILLPIAWHQGALRGLWERRGAVLGGGFVAGAGPRPPRPPRGR